MNTLIDISHVSHETVACMFLEWASRTYFRLAKEHGGNWFKLGDPGSYSTNDLFKIFLNEMEEELSSIELTAYYKNIEDQSKKNGL